MSESFQQIKKKDASYDVIISGMGPAGLAAAFEALKQNKKVLIFSNRGEDFSRPQRIYLDMDSRNYLAAMIDQKNQVTDENDKKFLKELKSSNSISTKDIERYIKKRLDKFPETQRFYLYYSELTKISLDEGKAIIQSNPPSDQSNLTTAQTSEQRACFFDYFIGADGDKHHSADVLNESLDDSKKIEYESKTCYGPSKHLTMDLKIIAKEAKLVFPKSDSLLVPTGLFFISYAFDRGSYEKSNGKWIKCSINAEIAQGEYAEVYDEKKDFPYESAKEYLKESLDSALQGIGDYEIELKSRKNPQKDKLKYQHFTMEELAFANQAAIEANGHFYILIGNSLIHNIPYQLGAGLNFAMKEALWFGKLLESKNINEYNENYLELTETLSLENKMLHNFPFRRQFFESVREKNSELVATNLYNDFLNRLDLIKEKADEKVKEIAIELRREISIEYKTSANTSTFSTFLNSSSKLEKSISELEKKLTSAKKFST